MQSDRYLRVVLTVIAAALVYLCVAITAWPPVSAQAGQVEGRPRPGESTGPAEMVIVGFRLPEGIGIPVHVTRGEVTVNGGVAVTNEVRVTGRVQTEPAPDAALRTILVGWEAGGVEARPGDYVPFSGTDRRGLPVTVVPQK